MLSHFMFSLGCGFLAGTLVLFLLQIASKSVQAGWSQKDDSDELPEDDSAELSEGLDSAELRLLPEGLWICDHKHKLSEKPPGVFWPRTPLGEGVFPYNCEVCEDGTESSYKIADWKITDWGNLPPRPRKA